MPSGIGAWQRPNHETDPRFGRPSSTLSSREGGVAAATIEAIKAGKPPPDLAPDEQLVYDLAIELIRNRHLGDALYRRAVDLLGSRAVVELVGTMGYYTLVSMTLNAFKVELPEGEEQPFPTRT